MTSPIKYDNIPFEDHEGSSTTDVESLKGDEKYTQGEEFGGQIYAPKSKRSTCLSVIKQARWFLDTLLLLVIVGLLVRDQRQRALPKTSEHEVGGDFTGVSPHCKLLPQME